MDMVDWMRQGTGFCMEPTTLNIASGYLNGLQALDNESVDQLDEQSREKIGHEAHNDVDTISEPTAGFHQKPAQQLTVSTIR